MPTSLVRVLAPKPKIQCLVLVALHKKSRSCAKGGIMKRASFWADHLFLKYDLINLLLRLRRKESVGQPTVGASMELQLERYLRQVEGGREVIAARERELFGIRQETEPAREIREQDRLMRLERAGEIKLGSGELEDDFWELPMPDEPEGAVLKAFLEDRN
jgi:hypothetical protein